MCSSRRSSGSSGCGRRRRCCCAACAQSALMSPLEDLLHPIRWIAAAGRRRRRREHSLSRSPASLLKKISSERDVVRRVRSGVRRRIQRAQRRGTHRPAPARKTGRATRLRQDGQAGREGEKGDCTRRDSGGMRRNATWLGAFDPPCDGASNEHNDVHVRRVLCARSSPYNTPCPQRAHSAIGSNVETRDVFRLADLD